MQKSTTRKSGATQWTTGAVEVDGFLTDKSFFFFDLSTGYARTGTAFATDATGATIGFFGATPVAQQTGGSKTAAGTYGANEQTMLQTAYNALRTFGLLS